MLLYFLFLHHYFFIALVVNGVDMNDCNSSTCGSNGPPVRFPFRIEGKQPNHCGYPQHWFVLSCSENNETLLHLTPSWKLSIQHIDYSSQLISAHNSQGCLATRLLNLSSLSSSSSSSSSFPPFGFGETLYTLFNCSEEIKSLREIPCLSNLRYKVYVVESFSYIDSAHSEMNINRNLSRMSCIKMHDIPEPVRYDYLYDNEVKVLELSWFGPDCMSCEAKGEHCRLQNASVANSDKMFPQTECYGRHKPGGGGSSEFIITGVIFGSVLLVGAVVLLYRMYRHNKTETEYQSKIEVFLDNYKSFKPTRFSYAHLKRMTNRFKDELGQGAYGTVFRGKLSPEILVAVKVLNDSNGNNGEEFINEIGTIGRIHHVNVVRLIGYCADGFRRALVYEYLPNNSLQKFISSPNSKNHNNFLGWRRLKDIALGVANGIEYLHQGCDQRILHFDIKPNNILLDHDFTPKVSDFGLAKLCGKDQSIVSMTTAKGTIGYMAPEVFSRNFGNVSYKSDVYSFGMLVLEMVGGRKIVDEKEGNDDEQIYFPEWIYNLLEEGEDLRLEIEEEEDTKIPKILAIVGLWCIQWNPIERPSMRTVVRILEGEGEYLTIPTNPYGSITSARATKNVPRRLLHLEMNAIVETE